MNTHRHLRLRLRNGLLALGAVCLATTAAAQQIETGGPIPDRRGFLSDQDPRYPDVLREGLVTRRVAGQVYVVAGAGGNIAVQAGDDGVLLVDNNFTLFYDRIMASIRRISDGPIRIVVNTHFHPDHLQNNANLVREGALVFSHPHTRTILMREERLGISPAGWPTVTSTEPMTFHFNGEGVLFVPLKPSHTGGDVAVYFTESDVWAFGDAFTTDYPSLSVPEGGSIENFIDNYNLALDMTTPNTVFVPGHGQLSTRADLIAVRDAIGTIHERFLQMVRDGMTLEQIRAARPSREFDARFATENLSPNDLQNSTRWYEQMYNEARAHLSSSP
jgi:glyoxylase-like metal-dependent hydrolase (beta-lactamase superfamily II)